MTAPTHRLFPTNEVKGLFGLSSKKKPENYNVELYVSTQVNVINTPYIPYQEPAYRPAQESPYSSIQESSYRPIQDSPHRPIEGPPPHRLIEAPPSTSRQEGPSRSTPSSPFCLVCGRPTTLELARSSNRNGNAGRPYYKCHPCDKFACFADARGLDVTNPWCYCRLPSRRQVSGRGKGRKVFYVCMKSGCDFYEEEEGLSMPEELIRDMGRLAF